MKRTLKLLVVMGLFQIGGMVPSGLAQPAAHFARFQAVTQGGGGGGTLPLDAVTGNYSSAYSTRLLRAAYNGPLINVRRSSDNATQDFYQGASAGTLNTTSGGGGTDLVAWVGANNGFVTEWYDQTGNGNHMSQATAANQPKIVSSGAYTVTQNGNPAVQFSSQYLSCVQGYAAPGNFTIYVACKATSSVAYMGIFHPDTPNTGWLFGAVNDGSQIAIERANVGKLKTSGFTVGTSWLFDSSYDGASDTLFRNGNSDANAWGDAGFGNNSAALGTGYNNSTIQAWSGWISEILVYSTGHSAGNKATLRSNIDAFWAIY